MQHTFPGYLTIPNAALQELQKHPHWVCYRKEERHGHLTKVPYSPLSGQRAQSNTPATWSDYQTAFSAVQTYHCDGLGYMFHQDFTGVDLDHCVDAAGVIEPWALEIIHFLASYTEFSPSGSGVHILLRGQIPRGTRRFIPPEKHPRQKHAAIEMYCEKRYFTITGHHVQGTPEEIASRQEQLDTLFQRVTLADKPPQHPQGPPMPQKIKQHPPGASNAQPAARPSNTAPASLTASAAANPTTIAANPATMPANPAIISASPAAILASPAAILANPAARASATAVLDARSVGLHAVSPPPQELSDEALLQRACAARNGERFRALYYQGSYQNYPSPSEAEMALCMHLAFWTGCDANRMDKLVRQSALFREKWDSPRNQTTYGCETIQRAIDHCMETYTPRQHRQDEIFARIERLLDKPRNDELIEGSGMFEFQHANESNTWLCQPRKVSLHEILSCLEERELGDAQLFNEAFHNLAWFDFQQQDWYLWRTHTWQRDQAGKAILLVAVVASYYSKAADLLQGKHDTLIAQMEELKQECRFVGQEYVDKLTNAAQTMATQIKQLRKREGDLHMRVRMKSVLELAEPLMTIKSQDWDQKPFLLPTPNGVINLETGDCADGQPDDYMRISCPTIWTGLDTPCPRWESFLQEIFADKPERAEIISFLQRLLGYGITGSTQDHIFSIFYGAQGRNGKDTLFRILHHVMGALANAVSNDLFIASSYTNGGGSATPHLESLQGMRSAWGSEPNLGDRLDIGQMKHLSGGGEISTRSLYGKAFYTFAPTHKLFMMTNHKLTISSSEGAAWDRVCLIDFGMRFIDDPDPRKANEQPRDATLIDALKQESSGILAWLVRGCLDWLKQGLHIPSALKQATKDYQDEQDEFKLYLDDCAHEDPNDSVETSEAYRRYKQWHNDNQQGPCMTNNMFGREMAKRFEKKHHRTGYRYHGIGLGPGIPKEDHDERPPHKNDECDRCDRFLAFPTSFLDKIEEENKIEKEKFTEIPKNLSHLSQPPAEQSQEIIQSSLDFIYDDADIPAPPDTCSYNDANDADISAADSYPYDDRDIPPVDDYRYDDCDIPMPDDAAEPEETCSPEDLMQLKAQMQCSNCRAQWEDVIKGNNLSHAHHGYWWCDHCSDRYALMQLAHQKGYPAISLPHIEIHAGCAAWLIVVRTRPEKYIKYIMDHLGE
jgi:putative DNA primase/helicase